MKIIVTSGRGEGLTRLSAFDKALYNAGVGNYNLIQLSSVIPEGAQVTVKNIDWSDREIGNKLYVVLSARREDEVGKEAWSGLGWAQDQKTGQGVFMEHTGKSQKAVERLIRKSLKSTIAYRSGNYQEMKMKVAGIKCKNKPVCAVVCAIYRSEGW